MVRFIFKDDDSMIEDSKIVFELSDPSKNDEWSIIPLQTPCEVKIKTICAYTVLNRIWNLLIL